MITSPEACFPWSDEEVIVYDWLSKVLMLIDVEVLSPTVLEQQGIDPLKAW
jgi:hypothetical protein